MTDAAVFHNSTGERRRTARILPEPPVNLLQDDPSVAAILADALEALGMETILLGHVDGERYTVVASAWRPDGLALPTGHVIPIGETYCREEITSDAPFVLSDARFDPVFGSHPGLTKHGLAAYVGAPVVLADGTLFGTLCGVDRQPRVVPLAGVERLVKLAHELGRAIEARLRAGRDAPDSRG